MPNIDGYYLTDTPLNSIRAGKSADGSEDLPNVPVIIGTNADEMNLFAIFGSEFYGTDTQDKYIDGIQAYFTTSGESLVASLQKTNLDSIGLSEADAESLGSMYTESAYVTLTK